MSSIDYAEVAGLNIALSNIMAQKQISNEDNVVAEWIRRRVSYLRSK
jgi:hypothetical protein